MFRSIFKYILSVIFSLITISLISVSGVYASSAIPEVNISMPVLVKLENGDEASGFYLRDETKAYFVTARHVLFSSATPSTSTLRASTGHFISYSGRPDLSEKVDMIFNLRALLDAGLIKCHSNYDVCIAYFGDVKALGDNKFNISSPTNLVQRLDNGTYGIVSTGTTDVRKFNDVKIGNESYIFGYPSSIGIKQMPQIDYERPLLRKGIIAGKNVAQKTIILDSPVYFGNSGGPVLQVDREAFSASYLLIGIVSEYIPFVEEVENKTMKYTNVTVSNSGYSVVIPIDFVLELLWK